MEKREQKNRMEIMLEIRKELEEKEQRMNEKIKERETETCCLQETSRSNTAAGSGDRASKQSRKKNKRLSSQQTAAKIARVIEGGGSDRGLESTDQKIKRRVSQMLEEGAKFNVNGAVDGETLLHKSTRKKGPLGMKLTYLLSQAGANPTTPS
mmetsp:Transcript_41315/g.81490  ORF Transcript_41315/g.81490 Transcript_41315/m.81490 type:complete len:153 (-) Transcript_41315:488-946(-)